MGEWTEQVGELKCGSYVSCGLPGRVLQEDDSDAVGIIGLVITVIWALNEDNQLVGLTAQLGLSFGRPPSTRVL